MNKVNQTVAFAAALSLVGCGDDHPHQVQQPYVQPQVIVQQAPPEYAQQQYAPQQYAQPQYVQPQVIQPQVVQHESGSGVGSFIAGAAAGALAGHLMTKDDHNTSPSYNDHNYSSNYERSPSARQMLSQTTTVPVPALPVPEKKNYMDMNKLSASAKQQFNTGTPAALPKPNGMDMSRLSAPSRPTVSLSKPSAMNMSKLGKR